VRPDPEDYLALVGLALLAAGLYLWAGLWLALVITGMLLLLAAWELGQRRARMQRQGQQRG